ncbi:MAG: ABC transporter ATP-binding protein [Treponemataceae bacterium]|nr:ABC transporter ATP-binding protein [Treponemataceae bacterium]
MSIIKMEQVKKVYPLGKLEVEAVKGATFEIEKGEFAVISGPSGSGKSTILNMIGLIDVPTSGKLEIDGTDIYGDYLQSKAAQKAQKQGVLPKKTDNRITTLRHEKIGFIFQNFNLIPVLNVYENVEFPLLLGKQNINNKEKKEWIEYLIEKVGLTDWITHKPNELSGGQRQRAAIARALVTKAPIILADEPTANLDSKNGDAILELMKELNKEFATTFVFSTHDAKIVGMSNHIIRLLDGEIIEDIKK